MAIIPGNPVESTITGRALFLDDSLSVAGPGLTIDSGESDSGNTPTFRLRRGHVMALRTSTGRYIGPDDANADAQAAAAVTALITNPGAAAWDGTVTITGHWGSVAVTLSSDDTDAAVVTAINAALAALNPEWGPAVATVAASRVVVTNRDVGAGTWLHCVSTVSTMYGASGAGANGTDPQVYITADESGNLQDINGPARRGSATSYSSGYIDESQLLISGAAATSSPVWPDYRSIFTLRGARFG